MNRANVIWILVCIVAVALILWWAVTASPARPPASPSTVADPAGLPGISSSTAPWAPELGNLKARLAADSMAPQTMEGEVLHIHQHLDIFVHGKPVPVPANIGIDEAAGWLSSIHVHDDTGIIHVESPFVAKYTLGEFFDIWGVYFTKDCIGAYCADANDTLKIYVNGTLYSGDPRTLVLDQHQEIAIVYGTAAEAPQVPSSFSFPAGY